LDFPTAAPVSVLESDSIRATTHPIAHLIRITGIHTIPLTTTDMVVARLAITTSLIPRRSGTVPGLLYTRQRLIIRGIPVAIPGGVSTDAGTAAEAGTVVGTGAGAVIGTDAGTEIRVGMAMGAGTGAESGPATGMGVEWL
jgi:hypothetical protein